MTTDLQLGVAKQTLLHDLSQLRRAYPQDSDLQRVEGSTAAFFASAAELDQTLAAIDTDPHLSAEGKQAKRSEAVAAWNVTAAKHRQEVEAAARRPLDSQAQVPTLPAPTDDSLLLEAKLANARTDARMYLDGVETQHLPRRMRELVERNADPSLTYLLLATDWGEHYLRSRVPADDRTGAAREAVHTNLMEWAHLRGDLTRSRLSPQQREAWDRQRALAGALPRAAALITAAIDHTLRSRRP